MHERQNLSLPMPTTTTAWEGLYEKGLRHSSGSAARVRIMRSSSRSHISAKTNRKHSEYKASNQIRGRAQPRAVLDQRVGLVHEGRKCGVRSDESNGDGQTKCFVEPSAGRGIGGEPAEDEAPGKIDDKCSNRKARECADAYDANQQPRDCAEETREPNGDASEEKFSHDSV